MSIQFIFVTIYIYIYIYIYEYVEHYSIHKRVANKVYITLGCGTRVEKAFIFMANIGIIIITYALNL